MSDQAAAFQEVQLPTKINTGKLGIDFSTFYDLQL